MAQLIHFFKIHLERIVEKTERGRWDDTITETRRPVFNIHAFL